MRAKRQRTSKRLDLLLVERGLAASQKAAQALVLAGEVKVDGVLEQKAGGHVMPDAEIEIISRAPKYASRGGLKLEGALLDFSINPTGLVCLDIGSSNGGFTDCLLQSGAARVFAVDVNVAQLDWKLRHDSRVVSIKLNARNLKPNDLDEPVDLVVADVSFISLKKIIAPAALCAKPGARFLFLVKPQFELPPEEVSIDGIVELVALQMKAIVSVGESARAAGLCDGDSRPSHLKGAHGNQEYFLHARKPL
jgi:23S rRNA (cytidine1920-2'-O)/16S rRNA (cytidine1409-2'-O)-methyltransferase